MATSKTFRVSFKDGALRITRNGRLIGRACRGATMFVRTDLNLRPGEYVLEQGRYSNGEPLDIVLVRHERGRSLHSYENKNQARPTPILRISVRTAAGLNIVDGFWRVRRLDRRTARDWNKPRA